MAAELARRCGLPLLAKDPIKEILFDTLGWSDRAWSRRLGVAVYPVLFHVAGEMLGAGRSLVLEANFDHQRARADLLALPPARVIQVYCTAPPDVLLERYDVRARSGVRHAAHGPLDAEQEARIRGGEFGPLDVDGLRFDVETEPFDDVSLAEIEVAIGDVVSPEGAPPVPSADALTTLLRESFPPDEVSEDDLRRAADGIHALLAEALGG